MPAASEDMLAALEGVLSRALGSRLALSTVSRLSGGASQETWRIDAEIDGSPERLVLRRGPGGQAKDPSATTNVSLETEAKLLARAREAGVPAPRVRHVLTPDDGLGSGFVMDFIDGETIARKILRDEAYAEARPKLARQCGEIAANIHAISPDSLTLSSLPPRVQLDRYRDIYDEYDYPHPVFEYAFAWLDQHVPEIEAERLVHGDFRNGNLIVGPDGVRAVLDWELAHTGDPMEDLGWICVNSWRFGEIDRPVGGFGAREDLFAGYTAAGGTVDPARVKFWETFGSLKWGIMCMTMYDVYKTGADRSVERAAIGRRSSETEVDLLRLIAEEN